MSTQPNKRKTALVTGFTGQDGRYLARLLLDKGYKVYGMVRRSSHPDFSFIEEMGLQDVEVVEGDLSDGGSLGEVIRNTMPDEIYNLGAMSHVGTSFHQPEYTVDVTGVGVLRLLEQIRLHCPKAKLYSAGSSEMWGDVIEVPQKEGTEFRPRSPYAVAKVFAHNICKVYRESYGLYAASAILHNHESLPKNSPVIVKDDEGFIDILPISDMFKLHRYEGLKEAYKDILVWNGEDWTRVINGTCYQDIEKPMRIFHTTERCIETTYDHVIFDKDNQEKKNIDFVVGDSLFKPNYPENNEALCEDLDFVYFLGFVVGDGYVSEDGKMRITGVDKDELLEVASKIVTKYAWTYRLRNQGPGKYENCKNDIYVIDFNNPTSYGRWLRSMIYTEAGEKRVPRFVLNSCVKTKKAFLDGYYAADGLKSHHAGDYEYKGFTTNSATLALGIITIFMSFNKQRVVCSCEYREGRRYYYIRFRNPNHFDWNPRKDRNKIFKITESKSEDGWFYDLQTESETFASGPNLCKIHNSPHRGKLFVTRKITDYIGQYINGHTDKPLELGYIDSKRDWSFAGDMVEGMWRILQQDKPDDFVLSSNETHTVREFAELAFARAGITLGWRGEGIEEVGFNLEEPNKVLIKVNPEFYRPAEVPLLLGDSTKARTVLGWKPKVSFRQLVDMMVDYDIKRYKNVHTKYQTDNAKATKPTNQK